MTIAGELEKIETVFIDTAPIIYYIEAHPEYGQISQEIVNYFLSGKLTALSSIITLIEVLSKPMEMKNAKLASKFADFLKHGKNINLIDIDTNIAESASRLKWKYAKLRTLDAIQISSSIEVGAELFITNDRD
ncbi:MAG: PIN domain-containing protein [Bacteroidota bacterium]|nr:PIN domain-containing protein [Bacteroidota bacterium]